METEKSNPQTADGSSWWAVLWVAGMAFLIVGAVLCAGLAPSVDPMTGLFWALMIMTISTAGAFICITTLFIVRVRGINARSK